MNRIDHGSLPPRWRCHGANERATRVCARPFYVACGVARKSVVLQED